MDLYTLSKFIKNHPFYKIRRDEILNIYSELSTAKNLNVDAVLRRISERWQEVYEDIKNTKDVLLKVHQEHTLLRFQGVQFVCYGEELYPPLCYRMQDPPLVLSYKGAPAWLNTKTLSVVGSREAQSESLTWMEKELALFCEKERPCIVSGGARGIDQKAHGVALRKHCPTIAVLPSGLGEMYPTSLQEWESAIISGGGCVVSEYDYSQRMHKKLFHHRNRLIAALGRASLLVEARRRSGTLITAHQALQLGRSVWVVPGHPMDPHFLGSLDLLMDGATLVRDAEDLLMFFNAEFIGDEMSPVQMGVSLEYEYYP